MGEKDKKTKGEEEQEEEEEDICRPQGKKIVSVPL